MTEKWFGIGCHLLSASVLNFAEAPETLQRDTRETGPSIVFNGARLWESQAAMVQARILGTDGLKRVAFRLLMPIGYKMADLRFKKQRPGLFLKILYTLAVARGQSGLLNPTLISPLENVRRTVGVVINRCPHDQQTLQDKYYQNQ